MPWYNHYFTDKWKDAFYAQARKQFSAHPELVDDAFQNAWFCLLEKLSKSDKIKQTDAYVMTVFKNLLSDEYRTHFGRCRPREWVKRLGGFWVKVATLLCMENPPTEVLAERVCCQEPQTSTDIPCTEHVQQIVLRLRKEEYCSRTGTLETALPEHFEPQDARLGPKDSIADSELGLLINILLNADLSVAEQHSTTAHISEQWQPLSDSLQKLLSDDDRLLLIRVYMEGHKLTQVAEDLQQKEHKLRYQLQKTLKVIKNTLQAHQISPDVFWPNE